MSVMFQASLSEAEMTRALSARIRSHRGAASRRDMFFDAYAAELKVAFDDPQLNRWYSDNAAISMCDRDTLIAATVAAALAGGPVVEFGPYIGGTTIAFGRGLKAAGGGHVVSFEKGGSYEHDRLTSTDILADLKCNLRLADVLESTDILEMNCHETGAMDALESRLGGEKIRVVLIDADGYFTRLFPRLRPLLADDAIILVDDYVVWDSPLKEGLTRSEMDAALDAGQLATWGLLSGVTWIGQLPVGATASRATAAEGADTAPRDDARGPAWGVINADGYGVAVQLSADWAAYVDTMEAKTSPILVFEDGRLVGPAHSNIADIVARGAGRYVAWQSYVCFSSSDRTDPRTNGRDYVLRLGEETRHLVLA